MAPKNDADPHPALRVTLSHKEREKARMRRSQNQPFRSSKTDLFPKINRFPLVAALGSLPSVLQIYLSVPEYDRLKLLLITGKSGIIFPWTASGKAGQLFREGSLILQRVIRPSSPI